jgi:uncharacterized protein (TIGR02284 family)
MERWMSRDDRDTIAVLNDLIAKCKDDAHDFRSAAKGVDSSLIKTLFRSRAISIEQSALELQLAVRRLGADAPHFGHAAAALRQCWVTITAALAGHDEHQFVEESVRSEETAVTRYRKALQRALPGTIRVLVEKQLRSAQQNLASVRALLTGSASPAIARAASSFAVRQ